MSHASAPTPAPGDAGTLRLTGNRWRSLTVALVGAALVLVLGSWWAPHPADLPVRDGHVTAVTTPGRPVYVGVYSGAADGRVLRVGGVHVHTDATVPVDVEPLLCRDGAVSVTSDATAFCAELVSPDGHQLGPRDSLLVRVTGDEAGAAFVGRVSVTFRSGLRVGTSPAGTSAVVAIVPPTTS